MTRQTEETPTKSKYPYVGQQTSRHLVNDPCYGKYFVSMDGVNYLRNDGRIMHGMQMHVTDLNGGTYFLTQQEAQDCLDRYKTIWIDTMQNKLPFHPTLSKTVTCNQLHQWLQKLTEATKPQITVRPDQSIAEVYNEALQISVRAASEVAQQLYEMLRMTYNHATEDDSHQDTQT